MAEGSTPAEELLARIGEGDQDAARELFPLIYDELHRLAQRYLEGERMDHTLQATALVHEAWMRLAGQEDSRWKNRAHFVGVAATAMRCVLVDHARARNARKRGGGRTKLPIDEALTLFEEAATDLVALDDAIDRLGQKDAQLGRMVELRFFGGLTVDETAEVLGVSSPTVARGWRVARAWLRSELAPDDGEPEPGSGSA